VDAKGTRLNAILRRGSQIATLAILVLSCGGPLAARPELTATEACQGVPEEDIGPGIFKYKGSIDRVEPLYVEVSPKMPSQLAGARIYVRAQPTLTPEWLERVFGCHIAHHASCPAGESCPLDVGRVRLDVRSTGPGYVVTVQAAGPESGAEVLRRARALASAPGG
jgi:hypothetical protein